MGKRAEKTGAPAGPVQENVPVAPQAGTGHEDDPCRCKKVSVMTPRELLGTMLDDLAFWKRKKK